MSTSPRWEVYERLTHQFGRAPTSRTRVCPARSSSSISVRAMRLVRSTAIRARSSTNRSLAPFSASLPSRRMAAPSCFYGRRNRADAGRTVSVLVGDQGRDASSHRHRCTEKRAIWGAATIGASGGGGNRRTGRRLVDRCERTALCLLGRASRGREREGAGLSTVVQDRQLVWPDTFTEGPDGTLYVTDSRTPDMSWLDPQSPIALPTRLYAIKGR